MKKTYLIILTLMNNFKKRLSLISPTLWPAWLVVGLLWLITRLPYHWQMRAGKGIGRLAFRLSPKMRHITEVNLNLCFPELQPEQRAELIKKNFESLGIGIVETAMAWWMSDAALEKKCIVKINGLEHVEKAFKNGKGILLLSPHFSCLEMLGRMLGAKYPLAAMYRPHKNRVIAHVQERFRQKYKIRNIARHRMREVINAFSENLALWYAYDIDAGAKHGVFAPFFGVQTSSLKTVSRLAAMTGTAVIPIEFYRLENDFGYELNLSPALENFPSEDLAADAGRMNAHLEQSIRKKPEQYIWQYKRFKTRPAGEKRFY